METKKKRLNSQGVPHQNNVDADDEDFVIEEVIVWKTRVFCDKNFTPRLRVYEIIFSQPMCAFIAILARICDFKVHLLNIDFLELRKLVCPGYG